MPRNKIILCVDDEPSVRDVTIQLLSRAGYNVFCSGDPEEAYEAFCEMRPFLLLMDLVFDGDNNMNGIILADRMKSFAPNATFCALSGYIHSFDFGRLRQVFDEIFLKPVSSKILYNVAQSAFDRDIRWSNYLR